MPSVSILIPAYKAEKFIIRTVTSLFKQQFSDWEAIIISDDDHDYKSFLAKHHIDDKRLRFGKTEKVGSGPSTARNIALDMSRSPIIATLDADDTFDQRKLKMMVPMAMEYGISVSNIRIIDDETNKEIKHLQYTPRSRPIAYNELLAATSYGHSIIVYKKTKKLLYWPSEVKHCEDLLLITQIYDHYGKAFYFHHKLHNYYFHNDSLCRAQNATESFFHDRNKIINMLKKEEIILKHKNYKEMLVSYLEAGKTINNLSENKRFSYYRYISELRKLCPFLPTKKQWKISATSE